MSEKEKNNVMRSITMSTKMEMPISLGTLEYIAGVDPKETWSIIGDDDVDTESFDKLREKHFDSIKQQESTKEFQDKLKKMMEETINLYQGILGGKSDSVKPYTEGRSFNFILGMPRTGGTTLYQGLSDAFEWPWEKLLFSMTHNFMPNGRYCVGQPSSEFDMGWRLPWNFHNLIFELCQFLVYANNEAPDSEHIFLKSTALSYAVKFLNFLFGDKANYFVTTRHPGAITMSCGKDDITREDHMQNMLLWTNLYSTILRECRPVGRVKVVEYGAGLTEVINAAFEKREMGERLEETSFFEYDDYDKEFYESENVQRMFEYVQMSWKLFDKDFPLPEKCI
ncbi:hypothetical protein Dacet_0865 [Denitrovibrio acetiphilus DSM 12809]|uniref:Sulfotransferase n=1 Tax=Denitrovibrio acetiphilus (strain DSM 12809 / NBRC 114555 / N2460) TaxID=522772 RepID=D4H5Z9_DENA2|nr:sulfotransferase family protein [Denitrovibrio acetiphilus]ADD67645.1 hypothetical protein Dacet_0865 [Denitrovibrio acetiphilus DSM 12809]